MDTVPQANLLQGKYGLVELEIPALFRELLAYWNQAAFDADGL